MTFRKFKKTAHIVIRQTQGHFAPESAVSLSINLKFIFAAVTPQFRFSADMRGEKTPCKRKTACKRVFKRTGVVLAGITIDCRLWRMKGDCYGAAVKENSRSKRIFSLGTAREQASDNNMKICCFSRTEFIIACLQSAVRKSLIFERAAFPSKSVSTF